MISSVVMQPHPHLAGCLSYRDRINDLVSELHVSRKRDGRDIQRPKLASAPEKGRGPHCGKDRQSATVCPCRCFDCKPKESPAFKSGEIVTKWSNFIANRFYRSS